MRNDNDVDAQRSTPRRDRLFNSISRWPARWPWLRPDAIDRKAAVRFAAVALALLGVAGIADAVSSSRPHATAGTAAAGVLAADARTEAASRGEQRAATATPPKAAAAAKPKAAPAAKPKAAVATKPKKVAAKPARPRPVAGLNQQQMDNAAVIVNVGKQLGLPKKARIIAIATAMQESRLLNLANPNWPASMNLPNQGVGYDYDSVGLFQQRPTSGWGSPQQIMDPRYASRAFYQALKDVSGWQQMPVTVAAQTVQGSAFPDAYAQHEWVAQQVVNALG